MGPSVPTGVQVMGPPVALPQAGSPVPPGTKAVVGGEQIAMPAMPASLTKGMVCPEDVAVQKEQFRKSVEEQQRQGEEALAQQLSQQKDYVRLQAEQQKALAHGRWDQQLRAEEMAAVQDYHQQMARLQDVARQQKLALQKQASQLVMEYNARRAQQEINQRQYEVQLQQWEAQHQAQEQRHTDLIEEQLRAQLQQIGRHYN